MQMDCEYQLPPELLAPMMREYSQRFEAHQGQLYEQMNKAGMHRDLTIWKKCDTNSLETVCVFILSFVFLSVSVAELLSHSELDPDSDASFTEAEAQVNAFCLYHSYKNTAVDS